MSHDTCLVVEREILCGSPSVGQKMCRKHYTRWWKHGDPLVNLRVPGDPVIRFESKVDRSGGPDACHLWTAKARSPEGYGKFLVSTGKTTGAHIYAWELVHGPVPVDVSTGKKLHLDHECHNRAIRIGMCSPGVCAHRLCCNERHLIPRTPSQHFRGIASGKAKLTSEQIVMIMIAVATGESYRSVGRRFNLAHHGIRFLADGRSYIPDIPQPQPLGLDEWLDSYARDHAVSPEAMSAMRDTWAAAASHVLYQCLSANEHRDVLAYAAKEDFDVPGMQ